MVFILHSININADKNAIVVIKRKNNVGLT
jgi:hypothetical protein